MSRRWVTLDITTFAGVSFSVSGEVSLEILYKLKMYWETGKALVVELIDTEGSKVVNLDPREILFLEVRDETEQ